MLDAIAKGSLIGWIIGTLASVSAAAVIALFGFGHVLHLGHPGHNIVRTPNCTVMTDGDNQIVQCGRGNTVINEGNDSTSGMNKGNTSDAYVGD